MRKQTERPAQTLPPALLTVAVLHVHGGLSVQQRRQQLRGSGERGVVQRREPAGQQGHVRELLSQRAGPQRNSEGSTPRLAGVSKGRGHRTKAGRSGL